jgi:predicted glycoside hydrolase/deacetylase ChbG (UPF0249 family)
VSRQLIVNADDFGQSPGVNEGVAECHDRGIVTSASLMVRWQAAEEAAAYAQAHPALSVGLHVDLAEWAIRDGDWHPLYERAGDPETEIEGQLAAFRKLLGRDPTHIDGHQHVHREEPAKTILLELADGLGVPLRDFSPRVRYWGSFYAQDEAGEPVPGAISVDGLLAIIEDLPPGVTELGCHPAAAVDFESMYRAERIEETRTLCDPRVREALVSAEIGLFSFANI